MLFSVTPKNYKKTILNAELSEDGAVGTFKYKALDDAGNEKYFPGGQANERILDLMNELRLEFINKGEDLWNICIFAIDLDSGKFEVNFKYPD